jgi:hypothetical protein
MRSHGRVKEHLGYGLLEWFVPVYETKHGKLKCHEEIVTYNSYP